jgi:hypothetical protein
MTGAYNLPVQAEIQWVPDRDITSEHWFIMPTMFRKVLILSPQTVARFPVHTAGTMEDKAQLLVIQEVKKILAGE